LEVLFILSEDIFDDVKVLLPAFGGALSLPGYFQSIFALFLYLLQYLCEAFIAINVFGHDGLDEIHRCILF
jgi:hypothetical protein